MGLQPRWFLLAHALERANEMGLTRADVVDVIEDAEVVYTNYVNDQSASRKVAVKGDLAVVFNPIERTIVTVLPHTTEEYTDRQHALEILCQR